MTRPRVAAAALAILATVGGCRSEPRSVYSTVATEAAAVSAESTRATTEAATLMEQGRLEDAERILQDALAADPLSGPAHNTLGVVYFRRAKYYLAAWEFEHASRLLQDSAVPLNNLGLIYETVGQLDTAASWYEKGLELEPGHAELTANLARTLVRRGDTSARTRELLERVALDGRPDWSAWARERLVLMK